MNTGAFKFFVPGSATVHPVMWITYLNVFLVLAITVLAAYYAVRGRLIFRWVMLFNFTLGMLSISLYTVFFLDVYWKDILSKTEVSLYIIKPLFTIILSGFLTSIISLGRRRDDR